MLFWELGIAIHKKNILSYKTPLAQTLLGKKVNETVSMKLANKHELWTIQSIQRWVDKK